MKSILIYGGSFDPPHLGHLNVALTVQAHFKFETVLFLPCKIPVLKKTTQASEQHRLNMLKLMLKHHSEFQINTVELERDTPSYMSETLQQMRATYGLECSITLLLGMDAFMGLPRWHECNKLPTLCNLLVIKRQDTPEPDSLIGLFKEGCDNPKDLLTHVQGKVAYFDAGTYSISSTTIRENIHSGVDVSSILPEAVARYIKHHGLYQ